MHTQIKIPMTLYIVTLQKHHVRSSLKSELKATAAVSLHDNIAGFSLHDKTAAFSLHDKTAVFNLQD